MDFKLDQAVAARHGEPIDMTAASAQLAKLAEARATQIEEWIKKSDFTPETHTLVCFVDHEAVDCYVEFVFAIRHEQDRAYWGRKIRRDDGSIDRDFLAELKAKHPFLVISARPSQVTLPPEEGRRR